MRPARIHAEVAGQRTGKLARRVGRVEESLRRDGGGDRDVGNAGFDTHGAPRGVDIKHAVHLGNADDDRIFGRQRTPGERGPGTACDDLDGVRVAVAHYSRNLFGRARQDDGKRHPAVGR